MGMRSCLRRIVITLLLFILLCLSASANDWLPEDLDGKTFADLVSQYMETTGLNEDNFSYYFYNTVTGEECCFNETKYMVAASTYKLPLNMYYYDLRADGSIDGDEFVCNATLNYCQQESLLNSNNELSYVLFTRLGSFPEYKELMCKYTTLPLEEIDDRFFHENVYCSRIMMDVLKHLYAHQEDYQDALGYLKQAMPGQYFKKYITDYEIAHKYGSFEGAENDVAIIYTEQPILLAVYTQFAPMPQRTDPSHPLFAAGEEVCSQIAAMAVEYTEYTTEQQKQREAEQQRLKEEAEKQRQREKAEQEKQRLAADSEALSLRKEAVRGQVREQLAVQEAKRLTEDMHERALQATQSRSKQPKDRRPFAWWMIPVALGVFAVVGFIVETAVERSSRFIDLEEDEEEEEEEEFL